MQCLCQLQKFEQQIQDAKCWVLLGKGVLQNHCKEGKDTKHDHAVARTDSLNLSHSNLNKGKGK